MPLLPTAPIVPETCVPWPALSLSVGVPLGGRRGRHRGVDAVQIVAEAARPRAGIGPQVDDGSVCVRRMPESMMATTTAGRAGLDGPRGGRADVGAGRAARSGRCCSTTTAG